jgi:hypothetical protein
VGAKKVSADAVVTPSYPVVDSSLPRKGDFNLIYFEQASQVLYIQHSLGRPGISPDERDVQYSRLQRIPGTFVSG